MEPLKWPLAPDGYVPNSVIRSWGMKKKALGQTVSWNDKILYSDHLENATNNKKEDFKTKIFWLDDDEEKADEERRTRDANRRRKEFVEKEKMKKEAKTDMKRTEDKTEEKEDEKHAQRSAEGKKKREKEKNDRADEKEERKMFGTNLLKSSCNIQTKTGTVHYEEIKLERKEVSSTSGQAMVAHTHDGLMPFATPNTERARNKIRFKNTVFSSSTLGHNTGAEDRREQREDTKLCDTNTPTLLSVSSNQRIPAAMPKGPRFTSYATSIQPQGWTCLPQMPAPSISARPRPQFAPRVNSPVRDQMFLLSKEKNFTEQAAPHLDSKALKLFRKYKDTIKNSSHHAHTTGKLQLNRSPALKANLSRFPIQHRRFVYPEFPDCSIHSGSLCRSVQPEHVSVHQRVVQKIQRKDAANGTLSIFHYVIPMAAQNGFATLNLSGTIQYGRLQCDWIRGHDVYSLLQVSGAKSKDTASFYQSFVPS